MQISCTVHTPGNLWMIAIHPHTIHIQTLQNLCKRLINPPPCVKCLFYTITQDPFPWWVPIILDLIVCAVFCLDLNRLFQIMIRLCLDHMWNIYMACCKFWPLCGAHMDEKANASETRRSLPKVQQVYNIFI